MAECAHRRFIADLQGDVRVLDRIAPPRMGRGFRWLLASAWTAHLGDGLALAAGPLLVASQTSNAMLVALAALFQRLPWLVLGLYAGALADRVDRRRMVMIADGLRAVVVAALAVFIVSGHVTILMVLVVMLLLGVAEVFAHSAWSPLLPMLVQPDDLGLGNARLQGAYVIGDQIAGAPLGAFLFAAGMAVPFLAQAALVGLSVLLVAQIVTPKEPPKTGGRTHIRRDIVDGLHWLWHHDAVRTLALVIVTFNVTWAAAWAVMVLYALDHLHMTEVGFGFLTTAAAVGGLLTTVLYRRIEQRFDLATIMRACLTLEVISHLAFALTTQAAVAMVIMFVFGAYAFVWFAVSQAVRQRSTPMELQGRVGAAYMVCVYAGIVAGQALGGWIAEHWGLTAPFWFAFVGSGVTLLLVWRQLAAIAHAPPAVDGPEPRPAV